MPGPLRVDGLGGQLPAEVQLQRLLSFNELEELWSITYISNLFLVPMYARFEAEHNITRPEFVTLFCLHHLGPLIMQDVATLTGLPKNSVSRGVKRLLERRLIAVRRDGTDRRRVNISLTPTGERLFDRLSETAGERRDRLLEPLSPAERAMLGELLMKMAEGARERLESETP